MKRKNIVILLLIPFLVSLLGIVTINLSFNIIDADIFFIEWEYSDVEAFKINNAYQLKAKGLNQNRYPAGEGNELMWKVENVDPNDPTEYATITANGGNFYLNALIEGEVIITCANFKGNIFRSMRAILYENGAIIVRPKISGSQNNIDPNIYYGEKDIKNSNLVKANIQLDIQTVPQGLQGAVEVIDKSDNIDYFDVTTQTIHLKDDIRENEAAYITLSLDDTTKPMTFNFTIVDEGVNVYSYDDLLYCTNKSENGEIVVLRKSFESVDNVKAINGSLNEKNTNVEVFGNYKSSKDTFSFNKEVVKLQTTYNNEYIKQWNDFASSNKNYQTIDDKIVCGLLVKKDFYGNGYTINMHNLTFPYEEQQVSDGSGNTHYIPALRADNLFRGPLSFYTLGNPHNMPLISAFGQDNVGMYVKGDNITINDLNLKNCDFGNSLANLDYVGTVMELDGNNIKVSNSRLSNGKNVLRSFSSMNSIIENCMISNSRNFLVELGSNEYEPVDGTKTNDFSLLDGTTKNVSTEEFLKNDGSANNGDDIINKYLNAEFKDKEVMRNALSSIQNSLNDTSKVSNNYKGSLELKDTFLYQSGIASIALHTLFNGPYLFSNSPSIIGEMFSLMQYEGNPLVPIEPNKISGVSYPVHLKLSGKTSFYDYKVASKIDLTGLILENISAIANSLGENVRKITIDDIFPLKSLLKKAAGNKGYLYSYTDEKTQESNSYINVAIAYYGGGANLSTVDDSELNTNHLGHDIIIDLLDDYLGLTKPNEIMQQMKNLMLKTVVTVTGFEPFKFVTMDGSGYLFNQTPNVTDLIENAKGA